MRLVSHADGSDRVVYGHPCALAAGGLGDTCTAVHPQIVTISGRTIKKEAQADPERARVAIARIETLLDKLPPEELRRARELRLARNGRPVAS